MRLLLATAAAALLLTAPAHAATVSAFVDPCDAQPGCDTWLEVEDPAGESNDLTFARDGDAIVVTDARVPLTASRNCVRRDDGSVRCALPGRIQNFDLHTGDGDDAVRAPLGDALEIRLNLGAGNDRFEGDAEDVDVDAGEGDDVVVAAPGSAVIDGRAGDDVLDGGGGTDYINGGSGADQVSGGAGDDTLYASDLDFDLSDEPEKLSDDVYDGGEGNDLVSYRFRKGPGVTVDLADDAPEGGPGEQDVVRGVEDVWGSLGPDHLSGDAGANLLIGDFGADVLDGRAGNDAVLAGGSDDLDQGALGADRAMGGPGNDDVRGGGPDAILDGGPGNDALSPGASGIANLCGPGNDLVYVPARTAPSVDRSCERWAMKLGIVPERAFWSRLALPMFGANGVTVAAPCSRQEREPCVLSLLVTTPAGRRIGSVSRRARAGQRVRLVAPLRTRPPARVRVHLLLRRPGGRRTIRAGLLVTTR